MCFNSLFYKTVFVIILPATLSCNNTTGVSTDKKDSVSTAGTLPVTDSSVSNTGDMDTSDNAVLYFTIADTGQDYFALRDKMFALHKALNWPIDTMGRYFDKKKNKIVVSDTDEDEMYRGEYFPRRFPSQNLSLEYYGTYIDHSTMNNISLVTGIFETKKSADSTLAILRPYAAHSFVVEANVYLGCMH